VVKLPGKSIPWNKIRVDVISAIKIKNGHDCGSAFKACFK